MLNLIRRVVREELRYVHTSLIGKVVAVNDDETVDVQPLVKRAVLASDNSSVTYQEIPVIPSVPIATHRSGAAQVCMSLSDGDLVEVRFSMHSMDELLGSDQSDPVEPQDHRLHALEDAICIPVVFADRPSGTANAAYEVISDGVRLGTPNSTKPLVQDDGGLDGLATQLSTMLLGIKTYVDSGVGYSSTSITYSQPWPEDPTIQKTSDTEAS